MKVRYRFIQGGRPFETQFKELDGPAKNHIDIIHSDIYDGMCPAEMARDGKKVVWVEAKINPNSTERRN